MPQYNIRFLFRDSHPKHRIMTKSFLVSAADIPTAVAAAASGAVVIPPITKSQLIGYAVDLAYDVTDTVTAGANNDIGLKLRFDSDKYPEPSKTVRMPSPVDALIVNGNVDVANAQLLAFTNWVETNVLFSSGQVGTYTFADYGEIEDA